MAELAEHHTEDIGKILLQVQQEMSDLREKLHNVEGKDVTKISESLDNLIANAEADIKTKAHLVLNGVVNETIKTLPVIEQPYNPNSQLFSQQSKYGELTQYPVLENPLAKKYNTVDESRLRQRVQNARRLDQMTNPFYETGRKYLKESFGVPIQLRRERVINEQTSKLQKAKTTRQRITKTKKNMKKTFDQHLLINNIPVRNNIPPLPPNNNNNTNGEILDHGLYNLINVGRVPNYADLTSVFLEGDEPPLQAGKAVEHDWNEQFTKPVTFSQPFNCDLPVIKLDIETAIKENQNEKKYSTFYDEALKTNRSNLSTSRSKKSKSNNKQPVNVTTMNMTIDGKGGDAQDQFKEAVTKIRGYNELLDTYSLHQFIIRKGKTLTTTPEFESYKRLYSGKWGGIQRIIRKLEEFLSKFNVPMAYIDGHEVMKLAERETDKIVPEDMLRCITNIDQVVPLIRLAGQKYKGPNGKDIAATTIQSLARMYLQRKHYRTFILQRGCANKIIGYWKSWHLTKQQKLKLLEWKEKRDSTWGQIQSEFIRDWGKIKKSKRIEIHIPSYSIDHWNRLNIPHLSNHENNQLSRLLRLRDDNLKIIYVSPYKLNENIINYYIKLLKLKNIRDIESRLCFVYPENNERFPDFFSLSSLLLYSPHCLNFIRNYIKDSTYAYIVPNYLGPEDKQLAMTLKLPILSADPTKCLIYTSKSGSKRIFTLSEVNITNGIYNLYDVDEVISSLCKLILKFLEVDRWLFKSDNSYNGKGIAYIDLFDNSVILALRKEKEYGLIDDPDYWNRPEILTEALNKIVDEIDKIFYKRVILLYPELYNNKVEKFFELYGKYGGIIEAVPNLVKGSIIVNLFIEPDGNINILSTHEHIYTSIYKSNGTIFPEQSIPGRAVYESSLSIGNTLFNKQIIGYLSIDCILYWDNVTHTHKMCFLGIRPGFDPSYVSFILFDYMTEGKFDQQIGVYSVISGDYNNNNDNNSDNNESPLRISISPSGSPTTGGGSTTPIVKENRTFVVFDYIYHPGLSSFQFSTFFNMCRLNNISFDIGEKVGTIFMLMDSLACGSMGVIITTESLLESMRVVGVTFQFILKQIGNVIKKNDFSVEDSNMELIYATVKALYKEVGKGMKGNPWSVYIQ